MPWGRDWAGLASFGCPAWVVMGLRPPPGPGTSKWASLNSALVSRPPPRRYVGGGLTVRGTVATLGPGVLRVFRWIPTISLRTEPLRALGCFLSRPQPGGGQKHNDTHHKKKNSCFWCSPVSTHAGPLSPSALSSPPPSANMAFPTRLFTVPCPRCGGQYYVGMGGDPGSCGRCRLQDATQSTETRNDGSGRPAQGRSRISVTPPPLTRARRLPPRPPRSLIMPG